SQATTRIASFNASSLYNDEVFASVGTVPDNNTRNSKHSDNHNPTAVARPQQLSSIICPVSRMQKVFCETPTSIPNQHPRDLTDVTTMLEVDWPIRKAVLREAKGKQSAKCNTDQGYVGPMIGP
ncbi:unnamed protein product, partial [Fusarium graminearum]